MLCRDCGRHLRYRNNQTVGEDMAELGAREAMLNEHEAGPATSVERGQSRISTATALIVLASFSAMMLTGTERAVADFTVTRRMVQVEHVKIDFDKKVRGSRGRA